MKLRSDERYYPENIMGKLIVIEGLDGAGKNTQSEKLRAYLSDKGIEVRKIDFPDYENKSSTLVKMYLSGELGASPDDTNAFAASTFFACDRYVSYVTGWKSFLEREGTVVIANRYTTANAYHQLSKMPHEDWDGFLSWLWDFEFGKLGLPIPDEVICLAVPPDVSEKNIEKRCAAQNIKKDIHEADTDYLGRCYEAAKYAADKLGWHMIHCVENGVQLSIDEIFGTVLDKTGLR